MSAPIQDLKTWITLRARAARQGVQAYRSDPADGTQVYVSVHHGVARIYPDMAALRSRIEDLELATV